MHVKKIATALFFSVLMTAAVVASGTYWQYDANTQIDMKSAKVSYKSGEKILTFRTVETAEDSISYCTYVYNAAEQTIQLQRMVTKTPTHQYESTFYPESVRTGNATIKARAHMAEMLMQHLGH